MKKIIAMVLIFAFILSLSVSVVAQTKEDIFYYDISKNSELQQVIKSRESDRTYFASYYLTQHLNYSGKVDDNKFTFHVEKAYAEYKWTYKDIIGFMNADNKTDFLKNLKVDFVIYPASYNGEIIYNFYDVYKFDDKTERFQQSTYAHTISSYFLTDKQEAERILKAQGFEEYEVLQTVSIDENWFIMAQKDNETVAIYVSVDNMKVPEMFSGITRGYDNSKTELYKTFKETFDNKIFTVSDFEKLDALSQKISKENNKESDELLLMGSVGEADEQIDYSESEVGGVSSSNVETSVKVEESADTSETANDKVLTTGELLAEDDDDTAKPFPWKYVGIGAGAVVIIGALALVLILIFKKKKA